MHHYHVSFTKQKTLSTIEYSDLVLKRETKVTADNYGEFKDSVKDHFRFDNIVILNISYLGEAEGE